VLILETVVLEVRLGSEVKSIAYQVISDGFSIPQAVILGKPFILQNVFLSTIEPQVYNSQEQKISI